MEESYIYGVEQKKVRFAHKNSPEFQLRERQAEFLVRIWLEHDTHKSSGSEEANAAFLRCYVELC